jgi:4-hydroxy-2-oxoheptanedioate aldolase
MNRDLKRQLRRREVVVGAYAFLDSADAAEAIALVGADFIVIDLQHSATDWSLLTSMIRAIQLRGASAIVRVASHDRAHITSVLDLGPDGLMLVGISSAADVTAVVAASLFAPDGHRETCSMTRAGQYAVGVTSFSELTQQINRDLVLMGIVEDAESIERLDEILAVNPGLDSVQIGRGDLAASLGLPGQVLHEDVSRRTQGALAHP